MPGEKELLREFVEQQFPAGERPAFAFLLEKVFDRMTLAGEAGSLLRIEEEIRDAIAEARALAQSQSRPGSSGSSPVTNARAGRARPQRAERRAVLARRPSSGFTRRCEAYAEQAENGSGFRRRPLRRRRRAGVRLHRPLPQALRRGGDESAVWPLFQTLDPAVEGRLPKQRQ
jgi:hypothetical protein